MAGFGALELAYNNALTEFKAVYEPRRLSALTALGNMANPNDYPDLSELDQYFGVTLHINPVPASAQLPQSLPTEVLEAAASNIAETQIASINNAVADTRERLGEELVRMAGVFQRHAAGEKTKLYGSLLDNMRTVTDLLEATNVTNDPVLAGVVAEVRESLVPAGRDIDTYKMSRGMCEDAAEVAESLASKLNTAHVSKAQSTEQQVETPAPSSPPAPAPELTPESVQEQFDREFNKPVQPETPLIPDLDNMF